MKPSLREVLADSHIAAVAIAVLLLWSLDDAFRALWIPLPFAFSYLATAVAILGIPYFSLGSLRSELILAFFTLFGAIVSLSAAWLLSRWVFGEGPLRTLLNYRSKLRKGNHA